MAFPLYLKSPPLHGRCFCQLKGAFAICMETFQNNSLVCYGRLALAGFPVPYGLELLPSRLWATTLKLWENPTEALMCRLLHIFPLYLKSPPPHYQTEMLLPIQGTFHHPDSKTSTIQINTLHTLGKAQWWVFWFPHNFRPMITSGYCPTLEDIGGPNEALIM
jgi:hypothetical protein